ncbi:hypothetical protein CLOM_g1025 [Closterium sp. NIES-68]|nr:hypothetical protein CLOM_g1025 [Closterium sp. NIES-68]
MVPELQAWAVGTAVEEAEGEEEDLAAVTSMEAVVMEDMAATTTTMATGVGAVDLMANATFATRPATCGEIATDCLMDGPLPKAKRAEEQGEEEAEVVEAVSDVAGTVKTDWLPMVERQQDRLVKAIRTDRGGEFLSKDFSTWLKNQGIRHSLTMPYSPAMNGIAERANRTLTETARGLLIEAGDDAEDESEECAFAFFSPVEIPGEPINPKEAWEGPNGKEWKKAPDEEMGSIIENDTFDLVNLPPGRKAISSKWLFKRKTDADGNIERYKSRLVAKGYQQQEKKDYNEVYAPVVKGTTLRTLFAAAAIKGWVVKQMDIVTAFLNGVLEEETYMEQPEG